jgi:3-dehydrotetronate 4-kinase
LAAEGVGLAVADAIDDTDLMSLGEACAGMKLVTAGSGLAMGLAENYRRSGLLSATTVANMLPPSHGYRAVISGSCSTATNAQVAIMKARHPAFSVDPFALAPDVALSYSRPSAVMGDDSQFLFADDGNWFGVML